MKKFFMVAVMAVAALSANAQAWVGGEIGFSTSHTNGDDKNVKNVTIKPEVGYSLTDNVDVAVALGYTHNSYESSSNRFEINPYIRYKFIKAGNFFAFVDGGVKYATTHYQGVENNINSVGINLTPGIAYAVSDKVTLVSHLGDGLYYNHDWQKDASHKNSLGLKLANQIFFGAYVAL